MRKKIFPYIIALSALSVSASAAFYSVFGLSHLFAGASTQVIIMAGALEVAKLVVASLLYQYWDTINKFLKFYFVIAVFILMVITSGGIYGYLSGAYAETATQSEFLDKQVTIINQKRIRFEEQRIELKKSIVTWSEALTNPTTIQYVDKETGQLVTTTSSRQRQLLESQLKHANMRYNAVIDSITKLDVLILNTQINNESARELGPLQYIATLMNKPMDQIINWFMLLIIFVFDPLAIGMVVAANMAFAKLKPKNKENYFKSRNEELERKVKGSVPEGKEFGVWYPIPEEEHNSIDITDEDENRMNIIGQNGNDGLHYEKELKKDVVIKEKVIKEYIKLPKILKKPLSESIKHLKRQNKKVSINIDGFFED